MKYREENTDSKIRKRKLFTVLQVSLRDNNFNMDTNIPSS